MCVPPRSWTVLKGFTNISAARLPQLALAEFLESGGFEKHLRQLRVVLWRSVDAAQQVLTLFPTGTRASPPEGGPPDTTATKCSSSRRTLGSTSSPGAVFSRSGQSKNCIRLNCGHPIEILEPAIKAIAALL